MPEMQLRLDLPIAIANHLLKTRNEYQSKLNTGCLQHDMAYGEFNYLLRRTAFHGVLRDTQNQK